MDVKHFIVESLVSNLEFVKGTLGDFSDADFFVRPCAGANHAAWQIGHMINSETGVVSTLDPGAAASLPAGFSELFKKDAAKNDEPGKFGAFTNKEAILGQFEKTRNATIALAKKLTEAELDKPSPEKYQGWAPTVGKLLAGQAAHVTMHVGQFQVIRRKLGKPVLF